jgi:probable addiction module antidote protein
MSGIEKFISLARVFQAGKSPAMATLSWPPLSERSGGRGMAQLAKDTGLSRESLYKSLSGERAPSADTLFKVISALGLKLTGESVHA